MRIISDLKYKAQCYYNNESTSSILRVLISDGSSAMILYRIGQFFRSIGLGFITWLFVSLNKMINGCVIGRKTHFDEGFVIMHGVGVVINGGVRGGRNVVVESGVVIGAARNGIPVEVPTLGDNIFIGAGAKILGGIKVGNNVKIGANAVVIDDVPDNVTVAGIPAKIVNKQNV